MKMKMMRLARGVTTGPGTDDMPVAGEAEVTFGAVPAVAFSASSACRATEAKPQPVACRSRRRGSGNAVDSAGRDMLGALKDDGPEPQAVSKQLQGNSLGKLVIFWPIFEECSSKIRADAPA
jgi:hypothetical protein